MRLTRILPVLLVITGVATAADSPIDGKWEVVSMAKAGGKSVSGTMTVDAAKKTIDRMPNEGQYKGKTLAGVYELTGDTLKIAFAEPGKERPAKVADGEGVTVAVYKKK